MNQLFQDFSESSLNEWKQRLAKDLKGISFEDLSVTDRNGITVFPFYTAENGRQTNTNFRHSDWSICCKISVQDAVQANKDALKELAGGADALCFVLSGPVDYEVLLHNIDWQIIHIRIEYADHYTPRQHEAALLPDKDHNRFTIVTDPIAKGIADARLDDAEMLSVVAAVKSTKYLTISGTRYQNSGITSTSELAFLLGHTNEYLNLLSQHEVLHDIRQVAVSVSCGTNFFEEIAKLRALRILLADLLHEYDVQAEIMLHVETSDIYRAPFDAYSNLLRDTISGMAAVLGGCNALCVHRFDQNSSNNSGELASRMSRNMQLIFKEESYLNQVADISAGSFYLDELTDLLANKAWDAFYAQEEAGGFLQALKSGTIKKMVSQQQDELIQEYKEGRKVLIGVNKYPNPDDKPHPVTAPAPDGIFPILNLPQALQQS